MTTTTPLAGLTESEARARRDRGEGNVADLGTSRSYSDIARANVFNVFNALLVAIGVILVALGRVSDALISIGPLFLANALIRTAQEVYAKRQLDRIALAGRTKVAVIRDGRERLIDSADLVRGDLLHLRPGDAIVGDGTVIGEGPIEVDESLLTGESEPVPKGPGERLLSGSYCVSGDGFYAADRLGARSYAGELALAARRFEVVKTPLQAQIDLVVRIVIVVVAVTSLLILLAAVLEGLPFVRLVQISAVLTAQVPYGLFFMTIVAYALSAAVVARKGAVLQRVSAVESLSNVDVLCMDKTGTLTTNRLKYHGMRPLGFNTRDDVEPLLGRFVRSASAPNRTSQAIAAGISGERRTPADEIPFASSRGWSALAFDGDGSAEGVYALGAMEALEPFMSGGALGSNGALTAQAREWSDSGLRVLVFAGNPDSVSLRDARGQPRPPRLAPLALVGLSDEIRAEAPETLAQFSRMGIELKIVSGDDPRTVAALAKRAGLTIETPPVSGAELARMNDEEFTRAAMRATIFGRVDPRQKEKLVETLVARGRYVAMIGDGVNDVLALKKAQLGIAMGSGSDAARRVADMVLADDSFSSLRPAFREGKRVVAGVTSALCLFMTRVTVATLVIVAVSMLGLGFPFEPGHVALSYLTAGIPSFFLIIWARPDRRPELLPSLVRFVIPAAISTILVGVALYVGFHTRVLEGVQTYRIPTSVAASFEAFTGLHYGADARFGAAAATIVAQTALSLFITLSAFVLILFLEPPLRFFTGWAQVSRDKRPAVLALALAATLVLIIAVPQLARYVALFPLGPGAAAIIASATLLWTLALRAIWRTRLFERFLSLSGVGRRAADSDR